MRQLVRTWSCPIRLRPLHASDCMKRANTSKQKWQGPACLHASLFHAAGPCWAFSRIRDKYDREFACFLAVLWTGHSRGAHSLRGCGHILPELTIRQFLICSGTFLICDRNPDVTDASQSAVSGMQVWASECIPHSVRRGSRSRRCGGRSAMLKPELIARSPGFDARKYTTYMHTYHTYAYLCVLMRKTYTAASGEEGRNGERPGGGGREVRQAA